MKGGDGGRVLNSGTQSTTPCQASTGAETPGKNHHRPRVLLQARRAAAIPAMVMAAGNPGVFVGAGVAKVVAVVDSVVVGVGMVVMVVTGVSVGTGVSSGSEIFSTACGGEQPGSSS